MYIVSDKKSPFRTYKCNKYVGKYLIEKGIPVLHKKGKIYHFSVTDSLEKTIKDMPIMYKILDKKWF